MVLFGLTVVPLSRLIREQVEGLAQAWYADNAAMVGKLRMISAMLRIIMENGPERNITWNQRNASLYVKTP